MACQQGQATENGEASERAAQAAELRRGEPQQVVQRIIAAPTGSAPGEPLASSNGAGAVADKPLAGQKSVAEPITSQHLEAELNRLEAELGR